MNSNNKIEEVLHLILNKRERDGGYYGYTSENFKSNTKIKSIFVSSVVCRLLLESAELIKYSNYNLYKKIRSSTKRTIALIEKNRKTEGTWNYYINKNNSQGNDLPDDLDDTFNSLVALDLFDEDKTDSNTLFATMKVLLATERKIGKVSAYNTWVAYIKDIDPVVQIITYKFLSRIRSVPRDFDSFLDQTLSRLNDHLPTSKYYESRFYILMELSSISKSTKYTNDFKKHLESIPNSILDSISYYQTKSNLGLLKKNELQKIGKIDFVNSKITPFYIERNIQGQKEYCYSDTVIVALYLKLLCSVIVPTSNKLQIKNRISKNLLKSCEKELSVFNFNINLLNKTLFENHSPINSIIDELISWSIYLNFDLNNIDNIDYIQNIAKYMYFGWIGYTVSDSLIDGQIPKKYLPIGNHFLFKSYNIISNIVNATRCDNSQSVEKLQNYIHTIYLRLHKSNYIESNPPTRKMREIIYALENKAIGHSVGFIMLYIKQKKFDATKTNLILKCFQLQLSIRQLSDDIHDWKSDIEKEISTLPTFLLKHIKKKDHQSLINKSVLPKILELMSLREASLKKTLGRLNKVIKKEDQVKIIDDAHKYLKGVKQALKEIEFIERLKS
jgi:hypothetical protein